MLRYSDIRISKILITLECTINDVMILSYSQKYLYNIKNLFTSYPYLILFR